MKINAQVKKHYYCTQEKHDMHGKEKAGQQKIFN